MKGFAIVSKGMEEITAAEIEELINSKPKCGECSVTFEFDEFEKLCILSYKSQAAERYACLLGAFKSGKILEELQKMAEKCIGKGLMKNVKKFKVECARTGKHDFRSVDIESSLSKLLGKKIKLKDKGNEIIFLVHIVNDQCRFGIDFSGFDMQKRNYKIFLHPNSLRGTIAYALAKLSGFRKDEILLEPFARDGTVAIESALYACNFPVNYYRKERLAFRNLEVGIDYDKFFEGMEKEITKSKGKIFAYDYQFKFVDFSRKNAKMAGIDKEINFSRVELGWLDIKFREKSIDRIATNLPSSKSANLEGIYEEFFYQCEYILKDEGRIAVIARIPELALKYAGRHNFKAEKEVELFSGEQPFKIIIFKKDFSISR